MDTQLLIPIFILVSFLLLIISYGPYIADIRKGKTKPHLYTWLIWSVTVCIGAAGVFVGGGGLLGTIPVAIDAVLVVTICILSLKHGTKDIKPIDTLALSAAFVALLAWVYFDEPIIAVLLATAIDAFGYVPTYRKSFKDPTSETKIYWIAAFGNVCLALLVLDEYSVLTTLYLAMSATANLGLFLLLLLRKKRRS